MLFSPFETAIARRCSGAEEENGALTAGTQPGGLKEKVTLL